VPRSSPWTIPRPGSHGSAPGPVYTSQYTNPGSWGSPQEYIRDPGVVAQKSRQLLRVCFTNWVSTVDYVTNPKRVLSGSLSLTLDIMSGKIIIRPLRSREPPAPSPPPASESEPADPEEEEQPEEEQDDEENHNDNNNENNIEENEEVVATEDGAPSDPDGATEETPVVKTPRPRGRPKGSGKPKPPQTGTPRPRGRPKGSGKRGRPRRG